MLKINGNVIVTEKYPNHETKVKDFIGTLEADECLLELKYETDEDIIGLLFAKKRLDDLGKKTKLFIWYMPYSRMDREISGDLFTLKYVCDFIVTLNFNEVIVMEPHSSKTVELLRQYGANVRDIYPVKDWVHQIMAETGFAAQDHIVYPDKGARARYSDIELPNLLTFDKKRNPETGVIEGIVLRDGTVNENSNCIIIDDLCSRGGTFMSVGNTLKENGARNVSLLVAHCEDTVFDGGLLKDNSPIDAIYTSDSILTGNHPKIKKLTLEVGRYGN